MLAQKLALPPSFRQRCQDERSRRRRRLTFRPEDICGEARHQLAFVNDPSRWKVGCCSRRAGKTIAAALILLTSALRNPDTINLYVTLSRVSGKRIVWRRLLRYNREYGLGGVPNHSELTVAFPNGATIIVAGAKDEASIENLRGPAYHTVVIDEAQAFREYVQFLVDDIIMPALMDTKGSLVLIGTPGKVRTGYFYEAVRFASAELCKLMQVAPYNDNGGDEEEAGIGWSVHHWTVRDNPHIKDVDTELAAIKRKKRWSEEHPTFQREYLGRWVSEYDALVYKYDSTRNGYTVAPDHSGPEWRFLLSVDQGYEDADAIGALAWRPDEPWIWFLELHVERKQTAGQLCRAVAAIYPQFRGRLVGAIQWDEGGGGKKVAEDARRDFGLPIEAAEKPAKVAGIEKTNELLRAETLKIPINSQAAADAAKVTWDPRAPGVKISGRYHTDVWDTIVYAVRKVPPGAVISFEEYQRRQQPVPAEAQEDLERQRRIKERIERANQKKAFPDYRRADPRRLAR